MTNDGAVQPIIEAREVSKHFGRVVALQGVSIEAHLGQVVALLGDNGAGKSTLIKILSGVFAPDGGRLFLEGQPASFRSPHEARSKGVSTVYQDLALCDRMSIARNFVLGGEPTRRVGPLRFLNLAKAREMAKAALEDIGISVRDPDEPVSVLSGGERQSIAIARAIHYGARVLILDEPTSALGVREAAKVQTYILGARDRGVAVILITHNLHHAVPVSDHFVILKGGRNAGSYEKGDVAEADLAEIISRLPPPGYDENGAQL